MIPCSDIFRVVSGKLNDEQEPRRWEWQTDDDTYCLIDALNAALREIVMQRPDATANTEELALSVGSRQMLPNGVMSLIDVLSNVEDGNATLPIFKIELDAMRTCTSYKDVTTKNVKNWAYNPLNNRKEFFVYPAISKDAKGVSVIATVSKEPPVITFADEAFPLDDTFANAAINYIIYDVLSGDNSESALGKASVFMQIFAQNLGVKLNTDISFPIRKGGVNDAKA